MNDNPRFPLSDDVRRMKISMVGDMATGKTCLCLRFVKNLYTSCHRATVSDIETKVVQLQNDHVIYQIWDTAGQERFRSLLPMYLRGIDGAIVVYDITEKGMDRLGQGILTSDGVDKPGTVSSTHQSEESTRRKHLSFKCHQFNEPRQGEMPFQQSVHNQGN